MLPGSQRDAPTGRDALRRIRVSAIFSTLLEAGPLARTDLAHRTGYSPSTVTGIVQDLSDAGYLRVVGQQESTGGRRRTLIELNRSSVTIAVVGLRGTRIWCALVDLDGNRLDAAEQDFDPADPVGSTASTVMSLHRRAVIPPVHVVVALPGVVASDGSVALAPAFGPVAHLRLVDELEAATGLRTTVENDVNLIALGERVDGAGNGVEDLVLIHVAEGIGATIIAGGEVLEGSSRSAGEIGFLPQGLAASPRGERGDYERRWTAAGIRESGALLGLSLAEETVVESLCSADSPAAVRLLDDVIQAWAFAAIICVCVVNPARVIFSGDAVLLTRDAREKLRGTVQRSAPSLTEVVFAELGQAAILHGAIAKVVKSPATLFTEVAG
ncbi:ROK family transcriptional regulator [Pseudarthrobacter sp. NIBRBAC000502772]|uniref:ROK family transcriptional regulator n=1 Tax=Pseudarthrobacter sp. NIBRBAC000502772 TaxID=2590775 RepID=UPI0011312EA0|nr:ROK family transcriptional regulator [Pseudarthrobacter sp. NIBRBAC000502772]QDG68469.1 ROK family transcriptional regulator [Pseudarthrobacter sp. NIBRBAC000502772]